MTAIDYAKDEQGIVTLTMDMPGQAVNTMTQAFRDAYRGAVERIEQERETILGVILSSGKPTFFAAEISRGCSPPTNRQARSRSASTPSRWSRPKKAAATIAKCCSAPPRR